MIRSLYSGISGMRAFQTKLDVISNNVANVNTSGYKLARTTFRDIMSQTLAAGTIPQVANAANGFKENGGINARQIGLGVGVFSVDTIFNQGSAQSTGVKTDLMIEGDGFFVVSETASGSALGPKSDAVMKVDEVTDTSATLNVVAPPGKTEIDPATEYELYKDGKLVEDFTGWPYTATGLEPLASYKFTLKTKLNGKTSQESAPLTVIADPTIDQVGKTAIDSIGLLFTRAGNFYFDKNRNLVTADGLFVMDTTGNKIQISSLAVAYNIDERGFIVQVDNKGEQIASSQRIGIAKFANPQGLEKVGSTRFRYTRVADADSQPRNYIFESDNFEKGTGKIRSGFLEMSNVDLGAEFSEMIMSQRGFQANTRIITTSDEVLQEVVNLKR